MNLVLTADTAGHLYLAYQSARTGNFDIYACLRWPPLVAGAAGLLRSGERLGAVDSSGSRWPRHHSLGHLQRRQLRRGGAHLASGQAWAIISNRRQRGFRSSRVRAIRSAGTSVGGLGRGRFQLGEGLRLSDSRKRTRHSDATAGTRPSWPTGGSSRPKHRLPRPCRKICARCSIARHSC